MAGATLVFARLAYAAMFVSQIRAGWDMPAPDHMLKGVARRRAPSDSGTIPLYAMTEARSVRALCEDLSNSTPLQDYNTFDNRNDAIF
jgi:hypothetical protein